MLIRFSRSLRLLIHFVRSPIFEWVKVLCNFRFIFRTLYSCSIFGYLITSSKCPQTDKDTNGEPSNVQFTKALVHSLFPEQVILISNSTNNWNWVLKWHHRLRNLTHSCWKGRSFKNDIPFHCQILILEKKHLLLHCFPKPVLFRLMSSFLPLLCAVR